MASADLIQKLPNPSDPDVIFYTCLPRGGVITPPLVKPIIPIEMYVFSSCCEIFQILYHTTLLPKFFPILMNICILQAKMTRIRTFLKIEVHASFVHQNKAKII